MLRSTQSLIKVLIYAGYRFLNNEQSLLGADAYYFDLAEAYAETNETKAPAILSFCRNPHWGIAESKNTIEAYQKFD